jgi:hypothetical protein
MTRVIHTDLELYLCDRLRAELHALPNAVAQVAQVDNTEPLPGQVWPKFLIVVHDFGGADTSVLTGERDVGISVLGGTKENPKACNDLALIVHAIARDIADNEPGNPIAAVVSSGGPYPVTESQPYARRYIPITYAVAGRAF